MLLRLERYIRRVQLLLHVHSSASQSSSSVGVGLASVTAAGATIASSGEFGSGRANCPVSERTDILVSATSLYEDTPSNLICPPAYLLRYDLFAARRKQRYSRGSLICQVVYPINLLSSSIRELGLESGVSLVFRDFLCNYHVSSYADSDAIREFPWSHMTDSLPTQNNRNCVL